MRKLNPAVVLFLALITSVVLVILFTATIAIYHDFVAFEQENNMTAYAQQQNTQANNVLVMGFKFLFIGLIGVTIALIIYQKRT
ncbi:hypothetical protein [Acidianus two-tailed virus 2]|nr:hypothetical protein [Acidianus two-tailed virus 2]